MRRAEVIVAAATGAVGTVTVNGVVAPKGLIFIP